MFKMPNLLLFFSLSVRGDFLCTFCRSLDNPEIQYCEDSKKTTGEQGLNPVDQRVSTDIKDPFRPLLD